MHIASCWAKVHLTGHFASCTYVFADQVIIDHSLCYSLVLFWTANSNMNKSMQILSEEILVICVGRFPVIIFFVLNERNGKITLKAGQWKIRNLGKKAFSLVHFYILIILLKRRSIFLCFKAKRSCFFDVLDVVFFSGEISRGKLNIVVTVASCKKQNQSDDVRRCGIWFCVCSFTRHIWKTHHWQLVFIFNDCHHPVWDGHVLARAHKTFRIGS